MLLALNREFNIVRTVLSNSINDIYVCSDNKNNDGTFYTLISVKDKETKKIIADFMVSEGSFVNSPDFVGTFMNQSTYNLVFRYKTENLLSKNDVLYIKDFKDRKETAINFIAACAEIRLKGRPLELLLNENNVNITASGAIYFNYFIDFSILSQLPPDADGEKAAAEYTFKILTKDYQEKYNSNINEYPNEFILFYKKIHSNAFSNYSSIIGFIKNLPDTITDAKGFKLKLINLFERIKVYLSKNSLKFFVSILVIVTLVYAGYQIVTRLSVYRANKDHTVYDGVDYIGEIFLGEIED